MFKSIIFDFDGTLFQTHEQVYLVLRELATEFSLSLPGKDEIRLMTTHEIMKAMGVQFWQVPRLTAQARRKLKAHMPSATLEPGVPDMLEALKSRGLQMGLVSSNSAENVQSALTQHGIQDFFDCIVTGASLFGKSSLILRALRKINTPPASALYVGDETRDVEASRKAGVRSCAVTWGFQTRDVLLKAQPDFIIEHPAELMGLC